jgi:hypothetical protein
MAFPVEVGAFLEVVQAFPAEVVGGKTCLSLRVTTKSGQFVAKLGRVFSLIATAIQAAVEMSAYTGWSRAYLGVRYFFF